MAPLKGRDHNPAGLGRAIINRKVKDARRMEQSGLYTTDMDDTSKLKSVTQERDLDEFLNTAELAGTDFTAERRNVKIIQQAPGSDAKNPYLLDDQEEKKTIKKHFENKKRLRVPRRPPWKKGMTTAQLDRQEKDAFLDWRRGLAVLQEEDGFLLTPFERNLEVWRQLWRVIERSHLVVQIVDARNPLRFRCEDLEDYVHDVEGPEGEYGTGKGKRRSLLLINKADLLTAKQRIEWANYFDSQGIQYAFFSAMNAAALQEARREALAAAELAEQEGSDSDGSDAEDAEQPPTSPVDEESDEDSDVEENESDDEDFYSADEDEEDYNHTDDPRAKVLSVLELEDLFLQKAPDLAAFKDLEGKVPQKLIVGLVGYPNVGKSSTINSLLGEKKVSVSSTPGKTKHFQTIHLSDAIVLCDCPGLVFPQFATTKAALVCDGVLPIDQMREYTGPTSLVVHRIPKEVLEAVYGLNIKLRPIEEGGTGKVTAEDFLISYAIARGFTRAGQGNPDEAHAARYILKDYVTAKLLYCFPPPDMSDADFNQQTHEIALHKALGKKKAPTTRVGKNADTFVALASGAPGGQKGKTLDNQFFEENANLAGHAFTKQGGTFVRHTAYPHQNALANDGKPLTKGQAKLQQLLRAQDGTGKKNHKKMKRVKQRSGKGYD
ncbi:P-loop containing nucleoside triphosphate hydrolase protein [Cylindrobasidium torrendii FP15055 ss-10]|uniref:p-loop containing nucleoside triphosphate hydrolase protein n=1 Tax=Cylindrobasidium torrendii FP15055 ss-10 TaxID=1314674 RepID=A0A0D7AZH8_9AGAR|nr:P-loop containing nucleoside triphosphate hydrolase protein [Cylindrobasidium torrendii FP15055 ss-10]